MCDVTEPEKGLHRAGLCGQNSTQSKGSLQLGLGMRTGVEMHGWESLFHSLHGGSQFLRVMIKAAKVYFTTQKSSLTANSCGL